MSRIIVALLTCFPALFAQSTAGRYIVELSTDSVSEHVRRTPGRGGLRGPDASAHRLRVRSEQLDSRSRVTARGGAVLDSVDTVANALFVQISDAAAAQLASLPGVRRVMPVRRQHLLLDRAVILHKVVDAWDQVGAEHAGEGIKIAIIDSGVDAGHPGLQDSSLTPPDSYPRVNRDSDLAFTDGKVIVARSYVNLLPNRDPDLSARDHSGHGTAVAVAAAGVRSAGPLATITGVAPKAYLGNYKVFGSPGYNDYTYDDVVIKAMDDAVADGMDIISMSLGGILAPQLGDDIEVQAVERATQAGVIVVIAAGNDGPNLNTISSPATAPSAIAVGATTNDRTFAASLEIPGLTSFVAVLGSGPAPAAPITAPLSDVAALDASGLACSGLPPDSLTGRIALILRGTCTFESKLINAQTAGAVAAVVYAAEADPDPFQMSVGAAALPAGMISFSDGSTIHQALAAQSTLYGTMRFTIAAVPIAAGIVSGFSSAGPNVDLGIKPNLTATGSDMYVATQASDPAGDMFDASGYILVSGTSFATPLVAGAAALLKAARPGLSVDQYRSLLINTAARVESQKFGVQQTGTGRLDALAALRSTLSAYPVSLSFGAGGSDVQLAPTLLVSNLGTAAENCTLTAVATSGDVVPQVPSSVDIAPGATASVPVTWNAQGLTPGAYQGFLELRGVTTGTVIRVPYWYAATGSTPQRITVLDSIASGRRNSVQKDAVWFRVTDASGVIVTDPQLQITAVSGGGTVQGIHSYDSYIPGMIGVDLSLGPTAGTDVFRIQTDTATVDVQIAVR